TPQHKAKVAAQIAGRHAVEAAETKADARSIFFVRTQMAVDRVTEQLRERGLPAAGLHGGMTQVARTKTLEDFKEGRTPVLVATDVAARGIHVDGIDLVVHLDPPRDSKDYLHRAGRTARAGQTGVVASLILPKQRKQAQRMMDDAGVTAEETDAAPVGLGGKWESASSALVELTGAREVPEPGDVKPFTLPVRERAGREGGFRGGDRREGGFRGGDRYQRDDRNRGFQRDERSGGSYERRGSYDRGGSFDRGASTDRTASADRSASTERSGSYEKRGFENRGFERRDNRDGGRDFGRREGGFDRRPHERRDGENRGFERREGENRGGYQSRGFERQGSDRQGSDRQSTDRPAFNRSSSDRPGFNRPGSDRPGFDRQGSDRPAFNRQNSDRPGSDRQGGGFKDRERGFQNRGFDRDRSGEGRGYGDRPAAERPASDRPAGDRGRGYGERSFNDRGRDDRGRGFNNDRNGSRGFDRDRTGDRGANRDGDRPGYGDRRPR
ncbi:MAG: helicase-related protein, partial [Actinocrinis sp.]